jgi:hypothetical protein
MRRNLYAIKKNTHVNKNTKRILIMIDFIAGVISIGFIFAMASPLYVVFKVWKS